MCARSDGILSIDQSPAKVRAVIATRSLCNAWRRRQASVKERTSAVVFVEAREIIPQQPVQHFGTILTKINRAIVYSFRIYIYIFFSGECSEGVLRCFVFFKKGGGILSLRKFRSETWTRDKIACIIRLGLTRAREKDSSLLDSVRIAILARYFSRTRDKYAFALASTARSRPDARAKSRAGNGTRPRIKSASGYVHGGYAHRGLDRKQCP